MGFARDVSTSVGTCAGREERNGLGGRGEEVDEDADVAEDDAHHHEQGGQEDEEEPQGAGDDLVNPGEPLGLAVQGFGAREDFDSGPPGERAQNDHRREPVPEREGGEVPEELGEERTARGHTLDLGDRLVDLGTVAHRDPLPDRGGHEDHDEADHNSLPGLEGDRDLGNGEEHEADDDEHEAVVQEVIREPRRGSVHHRAVGHDHSREDEERHPLDGHEHPLNRHVAPTHGIEKCVRPSNHERGDGVVDADEEDATDQVHVALRVQLGHVLDQHTGEACRVDRRGDGSPHEQGCHRDADEHNPGSRHGGGEVEAVTRGGVRHGNHSQDKYRERGDSLGDENERVPPVRCRRVVVAQPVHPGVEPSRRESEEDGDEHQVTPGQDLRREDPGVVDRSRDALTGVLDDRHGLCSQLTGALNGSTTDVGGRVHDVGRGGSRRRSGRRGGGRTRNRGRLHLHEGRTGRRRLSTSSRYLLDEHLSRLGRHRVLHACSSMAEDVGLDRALQHRCKQRCEEPEEAVEQTFHLASPWGFTPVCDG